MNYFVKTAIPSKSFLGYIQSFRAFAIFLVVAIHTLHVFSWDNSGLTNKLLTLIYSNGTVLFVFIAGYLFQHLSGKFNTQKYYVSKLNYVIAPYILVSVPAIIYFIVFQHRDELLWHIYDEPVWMQVIYFYITGEHMAPMWFIPMISLFYIIAPLLNKADKSFWFYYCLPAFFLISHYIERGTILTNFVHFFSAYAFGMFCSRYKYIANNWLQDSKILYTLIISWLGLIYAGFYGSLIYLPSLIYFQKIILCLVTLGVFIKLGNIGQTKLTQTVADTSFGVFFIHSYVLGFAKMYSSQISQFFNMGQVLVSGNPLLHLLTTFLVLFVSVEVVLVLQRLLDSRSRYLVGS
jgi:Acyltransferase family